MYVLNVCIYIFFILLHVMKQISYLRTYTNKIWKYEIWNMKWRHWMSIINGSVHSIQEFIVRQKVKFNAILIEYHGDSGMN